MAQLGWVAGPLSLVLFAAVTFYTCGLLADCYRVGDPISGKRNYTYTEAVQSYLGTHSHSVTHPLLLIALLCKLKCCGVCLQAGGTSGSAASASTLTCSAPALGTPSPPPSVPRKSHQISNCTEHARIDVDYAIN
jgi:hypothetical protein